jgi:VIT1/CCC1 family predicted Fe2+/Mn2+ transporter
VASNEEGEEVNRYEEILGQKKNFILHASVAALSFLVFGLVPPLVYGFSFYKSDDEYLKLVAVAAVSLLCITLLAIAKASIQNPPVSKYITTVLHYLVIGVGASGISYLAGYLVEKLIEKLGLFKSTAATVTLPLPAMSPMKNG